MSAPLTGEGPLTVNFSSEGSFDPDGTITAYDWDFGDGNISAEANPSHTYTQPGTYVATLVVFDNSSLSSPDATVTIVVNEVVENNNIVFVTDVSMTLSSHKKRGNQATARVTVTNQNGQKVRGALVTGTWSGVVPGTSSKTTRRDGVASLNSGRTSDSGIFTFTVTGIILSGYSYSPDQNLETSGSIVTQ